LGREKCCRVLREAGTIEGMVKKKVGRDGKRGKKA